MATELTIAASTRKSSVVPTRAGKSPRRSARDAVLPLTRTGLQSCGLEVTIETVVALVAMLTGMLQNQLSSDAFALAMYSARNMAKQAGVKDEDFQRVMKVVTKKWVEIKKKNPLGSMFL